MKLLEEDWGVKFFDRSRRAPAPIRRELMAKVHKVIAEYDNLLPSVPKGQIWSEIASYWQHKILNPMTPSNC